jgi:hypothetical protein
MRVQRIVYAAKPAKSHPERHEWETAQVVILLAAGDQLNGLAKAQEYLRRQHWEPVRLLMHSPVSEERVRNEGAEIWEAYQTAQSGHVFFRVFSDTFAPGQKHDTAILAPAIGEDFIDRILVKAGGRRLTSEEIGKDRRNADYLLRDWIFELKDLQEEGLEKSERQHKIAALYSPDRWGDDIEISPETLGDVEFYKYLDIVGGPIKTQVKSASKQIRQTREHLGNAEMRGGLIFLNTGYGSLPPALFESLVERYSAKDSSQIQCCVCISTWVLTNGFDWNLQFKFHPQGSPEAAIQSLEAAFFEVVNDFMAEWVRQRLRPSGRSLPPLKPVAFDIAGRNFTWEPPQLPRSWEQ